MALQVEQSWTEKYVLDFDKLLTNAEANKTEEETTENGEGDDSDGGQPVFSLITGTYRHPKRYGHGGKGESEPAAGLNGTSAMVLRNQDGAVAKLDSAAGPCFTVIP